MNYFLTEEQEMIRDTARQVAREKIVPVREDLDEKEEFPHDIIKVMGQSDLMGIYIPEEYGGLGLGSLALCISVEEISAACVGVSTSYAANALGTYPILLFGTDEQKKKYLPKLASGEHLAAFGLTEANAGSDASGIQTTAKLDGDEYVLNGTKQWITNGSVADVYSVIAITDKSKGMRGASAFIVDNDTPGFSFGKKEKKMGIRASATRELVFRDCLVPEANLIGKEGMGFIMTMKILDRSRPGIGAQAIGLAQGALEAAVNYAEQRVQFGQPIIALPVVQDKLANMATELEAARALVYAVARAIDGGAKSFTEESAMAKVFASDMAMKVATDAVQILGGVGYMRDYPVEKMMRDAKIMQIYEGTNEILRMAIAIELRKRKAARE